MHILLLGGDGRYARHLKGTMEQFGWKISAPGREEVDASNQTQVGRHVIAGGTDLVRYAHERDEAMHAAVEAIPLGHLGAMRSRPMTVRPWSLGGNCG